METMPMMVGNELRMKGMEMGTNRRYLEAREGEYR